MSIVTAMVSPAHGPARMIAPMSPADRRAAPRSVPLPARRTHRERGLALTAWHGEQHLAGDRRDVRNDHDREMTPPASRELP